MFGDNNYNSSPGRYGGQPANFAPYDDEFRDIDNEKTTSRVKYLRRQYFLIFVQQILAAWLIYEALQKTISTTAAHQEIGSSINKLILENHVWTFIIPLVLVSILSLVAFFKRALISKTPVNWIAYLLFTASFASVFAYVSASYTYPLLDNTGVQIRNPTTNEYIFHHGTYNYFYAFFLISMISLSLTVHTFTTQSQLTFQSASLYVVGAVLFIAFNYLTFTDIPLVINHILTITGIIWGFYIVWENESVVSGTKTEWSKEDFVVGAIGIYLSILTLFLRLAELIRQLIVKERS